MSAFLFSFCGSAYSTLLSGFLLVMCKNIDKGVYLGFKYAFSLLPLEQGFEAFDEFGLSVFGQPVRKAPCCC